ncbi:hypothetical protein HOD20_05815 [archaeon]|jgi:hypothetical protein|nr:hypothetical protein [archaeon]MBT4352020.1 hypothetical protein [archaeon]MBT4647107.1 hypothetical protein [archaeon]MBT6821097.1 hypothetical protein [archaeon]MBT7392193.1 hypothetical protein [archaeon]
MNNKNYLIIILIIFSLLFQSCGGSAVEEIGISPEIEKKLTESIFFIEASSLLNSKYCSGGYVNHNGFMIPVTAAHCLSYSANSNFIFNSVGVSGRWGEQIEAIKILYNTKEYDEENIIDIIEKSQEPEKNKEFFRIGYSFVIVKFNAIIESDEVNNLIYNDYSNYRFYNYFTGEKNYFDQGIDFLILSDTMMDYALADIASNIKPSKYRITGTNIKNSLPITNNVNYNYPLYFLHIDEENNNNNQIKPLKCNSKLLENPYMDEYLKVETSGGLNRVEGDMQHKYDSISCEGNSQSGDSGSIVIDRQGNAVSVILGGNDDGDKVTILHPIHFYNLITAYVSGEKFDKEIIIDKSTNEIELKQSECGLGYIKFDPNKCPTCPIDENQNMAYSSCTGECLGCEPSPEKWIYFDINSGYQEPALGESYGWTDGPIPSSNGYILSICNNEFYKYACQCSDECFESPLKKFSLVHSVEYMVELEN